MLFHNGQLQVLNKLLCEKLSQPQFRLPRQRPLLFLQTKQQLHSRHVAPGLYNSVLQLPVEGYGLRLKIVPGHYLGICASKVYR